MSRLPLRFRGLRWRLTLSYAAVTLVALLALVCVFVVVPGIVTIVAPQRPAALAQGLETLAPKLAPHLGQPVDRADLAAALPANTQPILLSEGITDNLRRNLAIVPGANATLFVLAPNGEVLASLVPSGVRAESVAGMLGLPETHALLAAALGGTQDPAKLVASTSDGQTIAVAPITDAHGQVLGVLVLSTDLHALFNPVLWTMLLSLLFTLIPFTVLASVLGTLFGLLTARGLTRRLTGLTAVADSWGHGDFTVTAHDPSPDELGQLARDLNRMAEQVQSLLQDRQQLAVVEERNRLARDLHDSVKQQIFATAMQVAAARALVRSDPGAAEARLTEIERLVSEAQHELTGLIRELRPAALGDKGLVPAVRELASDWSRATGIAAEVRALGERPASLEVEQALFRIAQEALSNVARHSGATSVDVRAAWEGDTLSLSVRDNGHGFDLAERDGKGVGLHSMRERVEALGGTLLVFGQADGTRVEARAPLPAQGEAPAEGPVPVQHDDERGEPAGARTEQAKSEARA